MDSERFQISFDRYLTIHDATLRGFDHFIESNSTTIWSDAEGKHLAGRLFCVAGVYLHIRITLNTDAQREAQVVRYSFHAGIADDEDRPIFRYDNAHIYEREGHSDEHHKHRFDIATGSEIVPPEWIGAANQPTLGSVLSELEQWWLEIGQRLPPISTTPPS